MACDGGLDRLVDLGAGHEVGVRRACRRARGRRRSTSSPARARRPRRSRRPRRRPPRRPTPYDVPDGGDGRRRSRRPGRGRPAGRASALRGWSGSALRRSRGGFLPGRVQRCLEARRAPATSGSSRCPPAGRGSAPRRRPGGPRGTAAPARPGRAASSCPSAARSASRSSCSSVAPRSGTLVHQDLATPPSVDREAGVDQHPARVGVDLVGRDPGPARVERDERLLRRVLGGGPAAEHGVGGAQERALAGREELAVRRLPPRCLRHA